MNARPALLALAVIATLAACGKKDAEPAATVAPPATTPTPGPVAPAPLARFRGQAVMGKDGWGLTVCGDPQQKIITFKPEAQAVLDGFLAGGAKEFFLDGWGNEIDGKPEFVSIDRVYTEGPGCDEKDLGMALFRAKGNEPFWAIDVTPSGVILQRPDQENLTFEYQPLAKADDGTRTFKSELPDNKLELTLVPGKCSDGMSDAVYGWTATGTINGEAFKGCAYSGLVSE
jgi:putative lipoprotein